MKKIILGILASGFILVSFSNSAAAQKKISHTLKGTAVQTSRGANTNIVSGAPTTDAPAPQSRGAGACEIYFVNYTGYYVNIYVDGYYKGQLSPYGSGTVTTGDGYTKIYCLTAGKTIEWSDQGNCYGSYTYNLYYP